MNIVLLCKQAVVVVAVVVMVVMRVLGENTERKSFHLQYKKTQSTFILVTHQCPLVYSPVHDPPPSHTTHMHAHT